MDTILVVDDEAAIREIFCRLLESAGFAVKEADSADAALNVLATGLVSVALCDIRMPGQSGEWLAAKMHAAHPTVPVIFVTANTTLSPDTASLPTVQGHLIKPIDRPALIRTIAIALQWRQQFSASVNDKA